MNILKRKFRFRVLKTIIDCNRTLYFNYTYNSIQQSFEQNFEITITDLHEALFGKLKLYLSEDEDAGFNRKIYCGTYLKFQLILNEFDCLHSELLQDKHSNFKNIKSKYKKNKQSLNFINSPVFESNKENIEVYKKLLKTQGILDMERTKKSLKMVLKYRKKIIILKS